MSTVKIEDVAFVRFRAPDLSAMQSFLDDFGLVAAEVTDQRLVFRGAGDVPVLHVTEFGDAGFAGVAFRAAGVTDLERLAAAEGAAVEDLDLPGGGKVVRLSDPDGCRVEIVAGQATAPPLTLPVSQPWNLAAAGRQRLRATKRVAAGPAHVVRLGHVVLNVSNFRASERWYKDRFGFITSDEVQLSPDFALGAFLRCDRGETPTDHHTLFLAQAPKDRASTTPLSRSPISMT
jgi:catechol 2,3-dioxygenase-like lactoylglutathione lyase family enzyme